MKKTFLFLLIILFFSCQDDISDKQFRNSNYAFYQEDGKEGKWVKVVANSEMNFPKSTSTYFFDNGNRYAELTVLDSFPNRVSKFYDTDDNLIVTERFSSDSLIEEKYVDGHYRGYYSNKGNLKSEGNIKNNKREETWSFYKEDGTTLKHTIDYVNNLPNGLRRDYFDTGELKVSIYYKEGEKNGKAIHYYKNQQIEESKTYKNGKEDGKVFKYFEDGSTKFSATYWNGKEIDTSRMYYPNGTLKQIFICIPDTLNNHFEGKLNSYYNSGVSKAYMELTDYKLNGIVKIYNEDGKLTKTFNYKEGVALDSTIH